MENGLAELGRIKKRRRKTKISDLPQELLGEILLWLPGESLVQCKCVRRSWNCAVKAIFRNREHVAEHLKRSRTRQTLLVASMTNGAKRSVQELFSAITKGGSALGFLDSYVKCSGSDYLKVLWDRKECCYTYPSDGLVCVYSSNLTYPKIVMVNPSARRFKVYEHSCMFGKARLPIMHYVGFGTDAIENVYKLVRLVFVKWGPPWLAQIRTFRSGDLKRVGGWRNIEVPTNFNCFSFSNHNQQVSCNGVYYWLGRLVNPIVSFDFRSETFRHVALPVFEEPESMLFRSKAVLLVWRNDRVVLAKYKRRERSIRSGAYIGEPNPIEMWELQGSGWRKFVTIPPLVEEYRPVVFWDGDELVLQSFSHLSNEYHLASYNVVTKMYRKLQGIPEMGLGNIYASRYVHSLVWFR